MEFIKDGKRYVAPKKEDILQKAKEYFQALGYKKEKNRWLKTEGIIKKVFYIQGSIYSKEVYYVRPGIFFTDTDIPSFDYGHICCDINPYNRKIIDILNESYSFLEQKGNFNYLLNFIDIPYEKRSDVLFGFYTEDYLYKKKYSNSCINPKINDFLVDSNIIFIRNDRLKLSKYKNKNDPDNIKKRIIDFKEGKIEDLISIKYNNSSRVGLIKIPNSKINNLLIHKNKSFISSWFYLCKLINEKNFIMKPVTITQNQSTIFLKGHLVRDKKIYDFQININYKDQIYAYYN